MEFQEFHHSLVPLLSHSLLLEVIGLMSDDIGGCGHHTEILLLGLGSESQNGSAKINNCILIDHTEEGST